MLFECWYSYFPRLKNFKETWIQNQNLPHLPLGEYLLLGIWVYNLCQHPNRSQLEWENRKERFFPPKLLLVKEFAHFLDQ